MNHNENYSSYLNKKANDVVLMNERRLFCYKCGICDTLIREFLMHCRKINDILELVRNFLTHDRRTKFSLYVHFLGKF